MSGNQDSCFILPPTVSEHICIGIFDGHSDPGGVISSACANTCKIWMELMDNQLASISQSDLCISLKTLFTDCHKGVCDMLTAQGLLHGGTTATLVIAIKRDDGSYWVVCANVGDSPAYLSIDGNKFTSIYTPHSASSMYEFFRMQKACPPPATPAIAYYGPKRGYKMQFPVFMQDGSPNRLVLKDPQRYGKYKNVRQELDTRLLHPDGKSTLAITRAIGDKRFSHHGVSCIPSISITEVPAGKPFVICAYSDGIDDVCGNGSKMCNPNDIIEGMRSGMILSDAAHGFFTKACKLSADVFGDSQDDCTIAAFNVNPEKPASAAAMADSQEEQASAAAMVDSHEEQASAPAMVDSQEEPISDTMQDSKP